jgi:uncharacterized membrane protein
MTVNPFDPRTVLFAKHAQHVVLIHFPIALFMCGVGFDAAAQWTKRRSWADAAYYNFLVAAISTIPVLITGVLAWQFALEAQKLKGILLEHMLLGLTSTAFIWITWWMHYRARRYDGNPPASRFSWELLGVMAITLTGHLGGFLSGVNGPG